MTRRRYLTPLAKANLWQAQDYGCAECNAILIELNPQYAAMARERIQADAGVCNA